MIAWQNRWKTAVFLAGLISASQYGFAQTPAADGESPHDLSVGVGKSVIVTSGQPIERVSVGFGDFAEASAVSPKEVLVNGKAPGETSLIIWQVNGAKLFFDLTVRPSTFVTTSKVDALKRQLRQELPGQNVIPSMENDSVFLRGTVNDIISSERAVAIAGTFGKTVNLLYVNVPKAESQILLKVQFATIDRSMSTQLGMNLFSTGAANTIGTLSTQQFSPPTLTTDTATGRTTLNLSDALNIFLLRPDLNLGATIKALESKSLVQILAEPNLLAINGKQASFLAGGEFPYPVLQSSGGGGNNAVTVVFREFGVRINFVPTITPRGSILLDVAPEVSALDFAAGLTIQGFQIPALTSRKIRTEVELQPGQSFAIAGLMDKRLTDTLQKVPFLGDIPVLGKLFQSKNYNRQNTELIVIVTPELVRPIPVGEPVPALKFPMEFLGDTSPGQTRNPADPTNSTARPALESIPLERLVRSMKTTEMNSQDVQGITGQTLPATTQPAAPAMPAQPPLK